MVQLVTSLVNPYTVAVQPLDRLVLKGLSSTSRNLPDSALNLLHNTWKNCMKRTLGLVFILVMVIWNKLNTRRLAAYFFVLVIFEIRKCHFSVVPAVLLLSSVYYFVLIIWTCNSCWCCVEDVCVISASKRKFLSDGQLHLLSILFRQFDVKHLIRKINYF